MEREQICNSYSSIQILYYLLFCYNVWVVNWIELSRDKIIVGIWNGDYILLNVDVVLALYHTQ
jgi:hypothetical protein